MQHIMFKETNPSVEMCYTFRPPEHWNHDKAVDLEILVLQAAEKMSMSPNWYPTIVSMCPDGGPPDVSMAPDWEFDDICLWLLVGILPKF
jgi:hypothetical protein